MSSKPQLREPTDMTTPYVRAPHTEGPARGATHTAPNAALLIDFDNVTMGMRSDLSKELKTLLNSDIIKGKVAVQRAYADWRRYPQYIVPLSEASIDLIFAPAYGSSKKNATDIRMAIDALELIFIRPEIGTFILLTGDSDFSSLVLKLKEYGKYVIGVGIQESSSDILVQNCDEYYSYTSLAGLRKTTDADTEPVDPWLLLERALERMERRNDVMRSDRLKQVMIEIDAGFDESEYGFSKFSRFLTEAASKNLVNLKRLDNGQYEVRPAGGSSGGRASSAKDEGAPKSRSRSPRTRGGDGRKAPSKPGPASPRKAGRSTRSGKAEGGRGDGEEGDPLQGAYDLLVQALELLLPDDGSEAIRDSDVKRKMLEMEPGFDEAQLGFSKFSRFLQKAHEQKVVRVGRRDSGNFEVALVATDGDEGPAEEGGGDVGEAREEKRVEASPGEGTKSQKDVASREPRPTGLGLGLRTGERDVARKRKKGGTDGGPPPLLEGQVMGASGSGKEKPSRSGDEGPGKEPVGRGGAPGGGPPRGALNEVTEPSELGLPSDRKAIVRYLANSYKGVGEKTAEALVDALGEDLFLVLQSEPGRVRDVIPSNRADQLLEAWKVDLERRLDRLAAAGGGRSEAEGSREESRDDDPSGRERPRRGMGRRGRRTRR